MNHSTFLVKVCQLPQQSFFEDGTSITEFLVNISESSFQNDLTYIKVSFWENSVINEKHNYKIDDYLIVEGFLNLIKNEDQVFTEIIPTIELCATKIDPLFNNS